MSGITKPMLAETCEDLAALKFPVLATPKLDGIRCLVKGGKALSRSFKPIANAHIQALVSKLPDGLDGELMLRDRTKTFQDVSSAVMSEDGEPDFVYNVFDFVRGDLSLAYRTRMELLEALPVPEFVQKVLPRMILNRSDLNLFEKKVLEQGYEGVMVRSVDGPYKCGRSTVKEGFLLKIKRFKDSEAEILGFVEQMHNANEAKKDELGHTKRSKTKAGLVGAGTLGALKVRDLKSGVEFEIGTGFTAEQREIIWMNPLEVEKKIVKYKFQEIGVKDKPRCPVFLGFRDARDL